MDGLRRLGFWDRGALLTPAMLPGDMPWIVARGDMARIGLLSEVHGVMGSGAKGVL